MDDIARERKEKEKVVVLSYGINPEPDSKYKYCVSERKGNCPYMKHNEYGVEKCSIDNVVQVRHFGCNPEKTRGMKASRDAEENKNA